MTVFAIERVGGPATDANSKSQGITRFPKGTGRLTTRLWSALFGPLPPDMREEECKVAVLFRASVALSVLIGGPVGLTLSALSHRLATAPGNPVRRIWWVLVAAAIDVACALLRGEHEHCATAWDNYADRIASNGSADAPCQF